MVSEAFSSHLEVFESFINRSKSDSEAKAVSLLGRFCLAFQNAFFLYVAGVRLRDSTTNFSANRTTTCFCLNKKDSTDVMSEFKCLKQDCKSFGHLFASNCNLQKHVRRMHEDNAKVSVCKVHKCYIF